MSIDNSILPHQLAPLKVLPEFPKHLFSGKPLIVLKSGTRSSGKGVVTACRDIDLTVGQKCRVDILMLTAPIDFDDEATMNALHKNPDMCILTPRGLAKRCVSTINAAGYALNLVNIPLHVSKWYARSPLITRQWTALQEADWESILWEYDIEASVDPVVLDRSTPDPRIVKGSKSFYRDEVLPSLSVVVPAFKMDGALSDFVRVNKDLVEDLGIEIVVVSECIKELPEGWVSLAYPTADEAFSISRTSNYGIKRASGEIIVKVDIDMILTEYLVNAWRMRCVEGKPIIGMTANVRRNSNVDKYALRKCRRGAFAGGVCLHRNDWEAMKGFNEVMFGYAPEDKEFQHQCHLRYTDSYIKMYRPCMLHMAHPKSRNRSVNPSRRFSYPRTYFGANPYRDNLDKVTEWGEGLSQKYWDEFAEKYSHASSTQIIEEDPELKTWEIHEDYVHRRTTVNNYVDSDKASDRYQVKVYEYAKEIYREGDVIDVGCGTAKKLVKHFDADVTTGLDIDPVLSTIREKYPDRNWLESDFNNPPTDAYSLLISADCIEHILDPDDMLDFFDKIDFEVAVVSTPDRDTLRGGKNGPPKNKSHYREWSFAEFRRYIEKRFEVLEHFQSPEPGYKSQVIVFRKKV